MRSTARAILITIVLVLAFMVYKIDEEKDSLEFYQQKYDTIHQQLIRTKQQRDSILVTLHNLDSINRVLVLESEQLDKELSQIKGRYKSKTIKELEDEMQRRAKQ